MTQCRGGSGAQWMDVPRFPKSPIRKPEIMAQFLPINGVAERYATSKHSIYRWLRDDRAFPRPIRLPSGILRWRIDDLAAWDSTRTVSADEFA